MSISQMPLEVFYLFADADIALLEQLDQHLSVLQREGKITTWHRRKFAAGTDWQVELDQHLNKASLILLLISPAFVASDYSYGIEMQRAMQRHEDGTARVIPLLLHPVDWRNAPFGKLKALPSNEKPVVVWSNRNAAFTDITQGIKLALEEVGHPSPSSLLLDLWNVPYQRNPYFTGREELLNRLDQQLLPEVQEHGIAMRRAALTQPHAITGLGGIGKTQIAVEYAYRSRTSGRYTHTFWVNAASEESILASFVEIAALLPAFAAKNETDQRKLIKAVKHWLEHCKQPWLLIFDNADHDGDLPAIREYLPQGNNGSILLTTRASAVGSLAAPIEVETMGFVEGALLLLRRAHRAEGAFDLAHMPEKEVDQIHRAGNIVEALDHFPLAIDQAGAYIEEAQCSFEAYLDLYQTHRQKLLAERGEPATDYPDSVATTWSLSFQKVQQKSPAAAELLQLCSFLAPDRIPEELITDGAAYWPAFLQKGASDSFTFLRMIKELLKFSLVKRLVEEHSLSIHRLVQAVQRDAMKQEVQLKWAESVLRAVDQIFPAKPDDITALPQCRRYLDQVQACSTLIENYTLLLPEGANLLDRAGVYLKIHALYTIAEPLQQRARAIRKQRLQIALSEDALSDNNVADLYRDQGKYEEAEPLYLSALDGFERVDPTHTNTAVCLNNLALLYDELERYEEAEPLYLRALTILEQKLGDRDLKTGSCLNNLANHYYKLGKYKEAEPLYERAIASWGQQEGINMALSLNNLGELYRIQQRDKEAQPLFQRALAIYEKHEKKGTPSPLLCTGRAF